MAPNLIRDCDTAFSQLLSLGAADLLTPDQAGALCRRLIGRLGDLAIWAQAGAGDRLSDAVSVLIARLTRQLSDLHRTASLGRLTADGFEATCTDVGAGLDTLRSWTEYGAVPVSGPFSGLAAGTPVTVYERAGRQFAVLDGGLS